jgi:L-fuculose-phosphate aldolase
MFDVERETVADRVAALADLTPGRTGNLSLCRGEHIAITPSGQRYQSITAADVPVVTLEGDRVAGDRPPSSELPLHRALYGAFEAGAVAHTHSPWATTLAVQREPLPPVHYVLALVGGRVPVADYATYGTEALGERAVAAMADADATACLLANHGLVAVGDDVDAALDAAVVVESVAQVYCQARTTGDPATLSAAELDRAGRKLADYGIDEHRDGS